MRVRRCLCAVVVAVGLAFLLGACGSGITVTLKGEPQKPLPPDCDFMYMKIDPDKASLKFQQLGIISVYGGTPGDMGPELTEKIRHRVCQMGGERVVPMRDEHSWSSDSASYLVLKSRRK